MWGALAVAVAQFLAGMVKYLGDRQLLSAGHQTAIAEASTDVLRSLGLAEKGRADMEHSLGPDGGVWSDGVRDKYKR